MTEDKCCLCGLDVGETLRQPAWNAVREPVLEEDGRRSGAWQEQVYAEVDDLNQLGGPWKPAIFDADSHLMETPEWLGEFADEGVRRQLAPLGLEGAGAGAAELMASLPDLWETHRHQEIGPEVLKGPKGWMAPGALDTEVRSRVLDALGIDAQLVFPTFALAHSPGARIPTSSTAGPRRSTGPWPPSAPPTRG